METKKVVLKYSILIFIHIILFQIIEPYGLNLFLSISSRGEYNPSLVEQFRYISTGANFLINILFVLFMIIDLKKKKSIEWIIIAITLFNALTGLLLIIVWKIYADIKRVQET